MARNRFLSKLLKFSNKQSENLRTPELSPKLASEPSNPAKPTAIEVAANTPEVIEPVVTQSAPTKPASATPAKRGKVALPANFDAAIYLKLNPDLGTAVDPVAHYLNHGHQESWRIVTVPEIRFSATRAYDPARETVMVVSHEASRSGAPILALNLVQRLSSQYNVVALILGDGPLLEAFETAAVATMASARLKNNVQYTPLAIEKLCKDFKFKFALVNSMECRVVLEPLARHYVPAIPLIHEFASAYPNSNMLFSDAKLWSSDLVFSADLTWESAQDSCPALQPLSAHIIPQGHCALPKQAPSKEKAQSESDYLRNKMRPTTDTDRKFVILGAGYVNFRKGADLFIQSAIKTMLTPGGEKFRFVWIGKGYNPDVEDGYSVYLADQIKRSGLKDRFVMLDETSAIETAYEEADLLFISSRLDPLPNVAIDAMGARLPVLCFDKATGISDFLSSCGLRESCIADYLDVDSAVQKIFALADSSELYEQAVNRSHEASAAYFDMDKYVAELESIGANAATRAQQEKQDVKTILDSGLFNSPDGNTEQTVQRYVRTWASGINPQPPRPDFKPDVYLAEHGVAIANSDPFADYIRANRPQGSWN
ncbi:glycosyltransferase [Pseudomonas koreensis]|uniref:Glycosyltransferase n=1 Tax=Pseudomonas koreensis TaxID=198620 RepID=A0A9X2XKH4_9PSED|nr:glycosyltransferase [Pseudomonas koreensis]MCU7250348.1 glycosyltransferase [Pseudomonas koreensis]